MQCKTVAHRTPKILTTNCSNPVMSMHKIDKHLNKLLKLCWFGACATFLNASTLNDGSCSCNQMEFKMEHLIEYFRLLGTLVQDKDFRL